MLGACIGQVHLQQQQQQQQQGIRYKLDLEGVQEVRWDKGGLVRAGDYNFLYGNGK